MQNLVETLSTALFNEDPEAFLNLYDQATERMPVSEVNILKESVREDLFFKLRDEELKEPSVTEREMVRDIDTQPLPEEESIMGTSSITTTSSVNQGNVVLEKERGAGRERQSSRSHVKTVSASSPRIPNTSAHISTNRGAGAGGVDTPSRPASRLFHEKYLLKVHSHLRSEGSPRSSEESTEVFSPVCLSSPSTASSSSHQRSSSSTTLPSGRDRVPNNNNHPSSHSFSPSLSKQSSNIRYIYIYIYNVRIYI
jgi:hypothetical protein